MAQKTRSSLLINFILLAGVLTAGYIVVVVFVQRPEGNGNGDNQCTYLMTVTFNPTPQDPPVHVAYSIAGEGTKTTPAPTSPWSGRVVARCGSVIVLTARVDPKYRITRHGTYSLNCNIQHGRETYSDSAQPGELSAHCATG